MMERHTTSDELSSEAKRRLRELVAEQPHESMTSSESQKGAVYLGIFCHLAATAVIWAVHQWIQVASEYPYMVPAWVEGEIQARRAAALSPVLRDVYVAIGIYVLLKCFHLLVRRETRRSGPILRKIVAAVVAGWLMAVAFSATRLASDLNPVPLLYCAIAAILLKGAFNLTKLSN